MTDKIQLLKNKINDIPVPTEKLDEIILRTVQEHKPITKRSLSKKIIYCASAIVAAFGLLLGSATVSPALASIVSKLPVVGSIFSEFGDPGLEQMSKLGLTQMVGESKKVGEKSLTIDEVFYDGTRFALSYSLESEKPMNEDYIDSVDFLVNGEHISHGLHNQITDSISTHYNGIVRIETTNDLPEEFSLHAVFKGIEGEKWEFSLPIHTHTTVKTIKTNVKQSVAGIQLSVTDIVNGPAGLKIKYEKGLKEDDLLKYLSDQITFRVEDNLGNELALNTGSSFGFSENGEIYIEGNDVFHPVSSDVKAITILPYFDLPKGSKIIETDSEGNEIIVDISKFKNTKLEFDSFTVPLTEK